MQTTHAGRRFCVRRAVSAAGLWLVSRATAWPRIALGLAVVATLIAALGLQSLGIRINGRDLLPSHLPEIRQDMAWRDRFGLGDPIVVLIDSATPGGILDGRLLELVRRLTGEIARIEGLGARAVTSLATERGPRVYPGTLTFIPLLSGPLASAGDFARLKREIEAIGLLEGTIVSPDYSATALVVRMPLDGSTDALIQRRASIAAEVEACVARQRLPAALPRWHISVAGAPVAERELGISTLRDLRALVPVTIVLVAALVWLTTGHYLAPITALLKMLGSVSFTLGLLGCGGVPIRITTVLVPIILVGTCVSDEIFIFAAFLRQYRTRDAGKVSEAIAATYGDLIVPFVTTSLMMVVGFLSFCLSPIPPLREFGLITSVGVVYCLAWSLVVTPALLEVAGRRLDLRFARPRLNLGWLAALARASTARPILVVGGMTMLLVGCALGVPAVKVQDSWRSMFSERDPFRTSADAVDRKLDGIDTLLCYIRWPKPGESSEVDILHRPVVQPEVIAALDRFEQELRTAAAVGGVIGPAGLLRNSRFMYFASKVGSRRLPESPALALDVIKSIDTVRGAGKRREVINDALDAVAVTLLVRSANYETTATLVGQVKQVFADTLARTGATMSLGGDLWENELLIDSVVHTTKGSIALTIVGIVGVVALITGSARTALAGIIPSLAALVVIFGAMGFLHIPLGVATSIVSAIVLGVGADFAVYMLELGRGPSRDGCIAAICISAVSTSCGFAVMMEAETWPTRLIGAFVGTTLLVCAGVSVFGISATRRLFVQRDEPCGPYA
jgi:uncharacterized protein